MFGGSVSNAAILTGRKYCIKIGVDIGCSM